MFRDKSDEASLGTPKGDWSSFGRVCITLRSSRDHYEVEARALKKLPVFACRSYAAISRNSSSRQFDRALPYRTHFSQLPELESEALQRANDELTRLTASSYPRHSLLATMPTSMSTTTTGPIKHRASGRSYGTDDKLALTMFSA